MSSPPYEPQYLEGIRYFNECDFFEAHEVWEELWSECQGPERRFYQGLIQVAVCFHHFGNGNTRGATKLYHSSRNYLQAYRPHYLGLDLDQFLDAMQRCCAELLDNTEEFPEVELVADRIPEIHLDPPPAT